MEIVHFTSWKNLRRIEKKGFLEPRTFFYEKKDLERLDDVQRNSKFITGIPQDSLEEWKKHEELYKTLMRYTTGEIKLSFSIKDLNGVLVRDHYYLTEKCLNETYHLETPLGKFPPMPWQINELMQAYIKSSAYLNETNLEEIKVPEIWVPEKIPFARLKIEEMKSPRSNTLYQKITDILSTELF